MLKHNFSFRTDLFGWCKKDVIAYLEDSDETAAGIAVILNEEINLLKNENAALKSKMMKIYNELTRPQSPKNSDAKTSKLSTIQNETEELRRAAALAIRKFEQELTAVERTTIN